MLAYKSLIYQLYTDTKGVSLGSKHFILVILVILSFALNVIVKIPIYHNICLTFILYTLLLVVSIVLYRRYKRMFITPYGLLSFILLMVYYSLFYEAIPAYIYSFLGSSTVILFIEYKDVNRDSNRS